MEIIAHQGFGEWVCTFFAGVCIPRLLNIDGNILTNKMVAKHHCFLVQGATRICRVQHHTHVVHNYRCRFGYIDPH